MAITAADPMANLPIIRQLEAVSFRSWPSAETRYDGTWAIRLTPDLPAKRLNSVNPMDPADYHNLDFRLQQASKLFARQNRPLTFRLSPLAPPQLGALLERRNWPAFDETVVMMADLTARTFLTDYEIHSPSIERWISQSMALHKYPSGMKPGLNSLVAAITSPLAAFVVDADDGSPLAGAFCVQDSDLAGIFEVISNPEKRGQGFGRHVVTAALGWARSRGAKRAWLQVTAENLPALSLYRSLGFHEVYRYVYHTDSRQD